MTNRECIEILKTIELRLDLDVIEDGEDAINMAIQALEKQEMAVVPKDYVSAEDILAEDWSE